MGSRTFWIVRCDDLRRIACFVFPKGGLSELKRKAKMRPVTWNRVVKGLNVAIGTIEELRKHLDVEVEEFSHPESDGTPLASTLHANTPGSVEIVKRLRAFERIADELRKPEVTELWASIGRGEGVNETLNNLLPQQRLRIQRLVFRSMNLDLIREMSRHRAVDENFLSRLEGNMSAIRKKVPNAVIEEVFWDGLPPFHGITAGDVFVYGRWEVTESVPGQLELDQTTMFLSKTKFPEPAAARYLDALKNGVKPLVPSAPSGKRT